MTNVDSGSALDFNDASMEEQGARLRALATRALPEWGLEGSDLTLMAYRENAVFCVCVSSGDRFALRVHRPGLRTDAAFRGELAWVEALSSSTPIRPPASVPTLSGEPFVYVACEGVPEPRRCDLTRWFDGKPIGSLIGGASGTLQEKLHCYRMIGEFAARIHEFGSTWSPPAGQEMMPWDAETLVGENPRLGAFWKLDCLTAEQRNVLLQTRDRARARLDAYGRDKDRFGMIHSDLIPENVLVNGPQVQLIDFNDSGPGWHLFEFASTLLPVWFDPQFESICKAVTSGYSSVRPLPVGYREMMPTFLVARALSLLGFAVSRPEIKDVQEAAPQLAALAVGLCERYLADGIIIPR